MPHPGVPGSWLCDVGVHAADGSGATQIVVFGGPFDGLLTALAGEELALKVLDQLDALAESQVYAAQQLPRGDESGLAPPITRFLEMSREVKRLADSVAAPAGWQLRSSLALPLSWPVAPGHGLATYVAAIRFIGPTLFENSQPLARVLHDATLSEAPRLEPLNELPTPQGTNSVLPVAPADLEHVQSLPRVEQAYAAVWRGHFNGNWERALREQWSFFRRHHGWWWHALSAECSGFTAWLATSRT
ncbi:MAG: hypothetical protein AB7S68_01620 [Polyangiaceae bacterium]